MVISIKNICIFLANILVSTGSIIFLDANFLIKVTLFLIFMVINIVAIGGLSKIKNLKEVIAEDVKKKPHIRDEALGSIIGIVWVLQMPGNLSLLESIIWIFTNMICLISTLYVAYRITNVVFHP